MSDKNMLTGKGDQVKGRAKQVAGKAVGDPDMEDEGKIQHAKGVVREDAHAIAGHVKDAVHRIAK